MSSDTEEYSPDGVDGDLSQERSADSVWVADSLSLGREVLFVAIACMAQFCTRKSSLPCPPLDRLDSPTKTSYLGTLVLLSTIGETFGVTNPGRLAWLVAGYSLTVGTFILFSGRLGDLFGYKRMFIIGLCWFSLWSMIAGLSVYHNFVLAVFSRVLQGIGPAICLPNALATLGAAYAPGPRKAMVFAFFGAVAPIGAVVGALFASLLAMEWWPWAQWVLALWLAFLAVAGLFVIPDQPRKTPLPKGLKAWVESLDVPGAFTGVVALILFNFAWTQAPISGWDTPTAIVPLILSFIFFAAFALIEVKWSTRPLLPFSAVKANVAFVLAAVACGWATFGVWTLYLVRMLEDIRHLPPLLVTGWFSPVTIAGACAAVITGKLLGPLNVKPPIVMTLALLAFFSGAILTATVPVDQVYWGQTFVSMLVMPFGMDMSFPASTLILSDAVAKEHQGIAASLVNTVVNYGIALGVGFAGTVEVQVNGGGNTMEEVLKGYRGALYMGTGLAGLGVLVCASYLVREYVIPRVRK